MKGSAAKIQMTSLDALFGGAAAQAAGDQIHEIPLTELYPFKDHPFHVMKKCGRWPRALPNMVFWCRELSVPGRRAAMRL